MAIDARTVRWVRAQLGMGAQIGDALAGGVTSRVHGVSLGSRRAVLKQVTNERWLAERPDVVAYEAAVLELLAGSGIPVPRVLALDAHGVEAGHPSLLLSWIDGAPAGDCAAPGEWLGAVAELAVRIGTVEAPAWIRPFARYIPAGQAEPPHWANDRSVWEDAIAIVRGPAPAAPERFIHRDFHPWNVLWGSGLAGVVDWSQACLGPVTMDVAHCRANLAIGFDEHVADAFRSTWTAASGLSHDPYWDLVTCVDFLPNWRPSAGGNRRLEAWVVHVLAELG